MGKLFLTLFLIVTALSGVYLYKKEMNRPVMKVYNSTTKTWVDVVGARNW